MAAPAMVGTVGTTRIPIPMFAKESFRMYMDKVDIWKEVCQIVKAKQGMVLLMHLPRETPSDIKELIMASVGLAELKLETGINKFINAMNEAFKPTDEVSELEIYVNYYTNMKKKWDESIVDYMNRFEKAASLAKKHKMDLPLKVKGLKLQHNTGLSD